MNEKSKLKLVHGCKIFLVLVCMLAASMSFQAREAAAATLTAPPVINSLDVLASKTSIRVTVTWTNADGATGYTVLRGTAADNLSAITDSNTQFTSVDANTTSFTDTIDTSSDKSGTYYYAVTATDGTNSLNSSPSSVFIGPSVSSTSPANNAVSVYIKPLIQATFNQDMDPTTIIGNNLSLTDSNGNLVTGTVVTYDASAKTADISIQGTLQPNKQYTLKINGVKDVQGIALKSEVDCAFTTGNSTDYPHGAYSEITAQCSKCHSTHSAAGKDLTLTTNGNDLCFSCHNGVQANILNQNLNSLDPTIYNSNAHFGDDAQNTNSATACGQCHTQHNTTTPKLLANQYNLNVQYVDGVATNTAFNSQQFATCINGACHSTDQIFSSTTAAGDLHYRHLVLAGQDGKGNAVCYECHRPHGSIASEIQPTPASNTDPILKTLHLVGFPSTSTVLPLSGSQNPTYVVNPVVDRPGGGCNLSCHGVTHKVPDTSTVLAPGEIDSRYYYDTYQP